MYSPNKRRLLMLSVVFMLVASMLLYAFIGLVQQTGIGPPLSESLEPLTTLEIIISITIPLLLAISLSLFVPGLNLWNENQKKMFEALRKHKSVKTPYEIIKITEGVTKATGYRHLKALLKEEAIIKNDKGRYVVNPDYLKERTIK